MADLPRKTLKVFGGNPEDPLIDQSSNTGIFGSREANSGSESTKSNDIELIQNQDGGNRWEKGWDLATIGFERLPPAEEMEGIHRVISYSAAYLLQKGASEFDSGTIYFVNDIVRRPDLLDLYASIGNNNNAALPTTAGFSDANWKFLDDLGKPAGTFIEKLDFTTVGATAFPIPTDMTERGYIDVIVVGGGSGGNNNAFGVAGFGGSSSFGVLLSVGQTLSPGFASNSRTISSGSVGSNGDMNIQGGSAGSGFFQAGGSGNNQGRSITLGGSSGSSIFSGSTQFGAVLDGVASTIVGLPPAGFIPFGAGGVVTNLTEQTDTIGGTGAGASIKRVSFEDLTSIKMVQETTTPADDLTASDKFDLSTITFADNKLTTKDLSGNIGTLLGVGAGEMSILANEIGFSSVFNSGSPLDFQSAGNLAGIAAVIQAAGTNLKVVELSNTLVFSLDPINTNVSITVGVGGTSQGSNITNGTQGIVQLKRYR